MHVLKKHKSKDEKIVRKKYPFIFKAFDLIIVDNIASSKISKKIKAKLKKGYKVPDGVNPTDVEKFLSKLSNENFEEFAMGDQDEIEMKFSKDIGYDQTQKLLGAFFNSM